MNFDKKAGFQAAVLIVGVLAVIVVALIAVRLITSQQAENSSKSTDKTTQSTSTTGGFVVIEEWGVRLKPVDGLNKLTTLKKTSQLEGAEEVMFMTSEMQALPTPACNGSADGARPLGALVRTSKEVVQPSSMQFVSKKGNYYFYYYGPSSSCSPNSSEETLQTETIGKIKASLSSLQ